MNDCQGLLENCNIIITPGDILVEEFLDEYHISASQLADAIGVKSEYIQKIIDNTAEISADIALRLSIYFGNSPEFWLNIQRGYDLKCARAGLPPEEAARIAAARAA